MDQDELPRIPRRRPDAHKGDFGRVLVLAGSPRMTGAAMLCAEAALRTGSGLVTLGMPARIHPWLASRVTCEMTLPLPDTEAGTFSAEALGPALAFLSGCDAFALGPGIGVDPGTQAFVRGIMKEAACPGVVDADGLNNLAGETGALASSAGPRVLTPHPGEFSRLTGRPIGEIQAGREAAATSFSGRSGCVVALKGAGTVVAGSGKVYINRTGNPGMASGGTGDVLTGVVASLLGQGFPPFEATVLGVHAHGRAGDLARDRLGEASCTARDVLDALPEALKEAVDVDG